MSDKKKECGWGVLVFTYVAGVAGLVLFAEVGFAEATAGCTLLCAVMALGGLVGQKFGEERGAIVLWLGIPIVSLIVYEWLF